MLTVLNIAYPLAPVGPDSTGGSEQIVTAIDQALVDNGHRSIVVACEGSQVRGLLYETPRRREFFSNAGQHAVYPIYRAAIERAIEECQPGVIHLHGIDADRYLPPDGHPALITLHLPPSWYAAEIFAGRRPATFLNCVSRDQQKACPAAKGLLPFIANGVPVSSLQPARRKLNFALALARICPEKGIDIALDAALMASSPLLIAGEIYPFEAYERCFREQIAPRLSPTRRYLGPVGFHQKRRLLAAARCLLAPSLAPETSSLVAMEALACGTPVIAFASGALREIVEDGVTGFLVSSAREMADAIKRVNSIQPISCRRAAVERFSIDRMTRRYIEVYDLLAGRGAAAAASMPPADSAPHDAAARI